MRREDRACNVLVLLFGATVLSACADRSLPASVFACGFGGPCADAAVRSSDSGESFDGGEPPESGEPADATGADADAGTPRDAATRADSGASSCTGELTLPASGMVAGDTQSGASFADSSCVTGTGAWDRRYKLEVPSLLQNLDIWFTSASFHPILSLRQQGCTAGTEIDCDGSLGALSLQNVQPGTYDIVVDGMDQSQVGSFSFSVSGRLAIGGACSSTAPYLTCAEGFCLAQGGAGTCSWPMDCADGFDNDQDSEIDEDQASCDSPPVVTCVDQSVTAGDTPISVGATMTDDGSIIGAVWSTQATPWDPLDVVATPSQNTVEITPELVGTYRMRFTAIDDTLAGTSCESTIIARPMGQLVVEALWHGDDADLDIHLLNPHATAWFTEEDCFYGAAGDWGRPGADQDPIFRLDSAGPTAFEVIDLPDGESGTYRVGLSVTGVSGATQVELRVHCGGRSTVFGPITLTGNNDGDLWKGGDIALSTSGCTVTPLGSPAAPVIVPLDPNGSEPPR